VFKTRVFFGPTGRSTRDYVEWFEASRFKSISVSIAARPLLEGGSETVIIAVYINE